MFLVNISDESSCRFASIWWHSCWGQFLGESYAWKVSFCISGLPSMLRLCFYRGWELSLSTKLALLNQGTKSAALYRARVTRYNSLRVGSISCVFPIQCRWTRLRVAMLPFPSLLEPFSECFCISLLGALSAKFLGFSFLVFLISYVIIWFLSDMVLLKIVSVS